MVLNPKRVLTPNGQERVLESMTSEGTDGILAVASAKPVRSVTVNPTTNELTDVVVGDQGFGVAESLTFSSTIAVSSSGKRYQASDLIVWTGVSVTTPQTIVGVVLHLTANATVFLAYLEFDEPIEVDSTGETIRVAIEVNITPTGLNFVPRVLSLGV